VSQDLWREFRPDTGRSVSRRIVCGHQRKL
jgi:hypothetical protein